MTCTNCYDLCSLDPYNNLLGTVDLPEDTFVELIIEHIGTGRMEIQEAEVGAGGEVRIDLTDEFIQDGQSYRVRIAEVLYGDMGENLDITPPGNTATYGCVSFEFKNICL
jgi:hypothetical protein